jgi:dihydrofolate synthase/folylpolyglutamate synthase
MKSNTPPGYLEKLKYLYSIAPLYDRLGAAAYKPGLATMYALDEILDYPHTAYQTIHVAGTNGKGSVCHTIAAILQQAGYKVGLYTSPHLRDFSERIRVNGIPVDKQYVIDFINRHKALIEELHPSFFEVATIMAFDYFRQEKVDFAVIETGLGGRLDSTNIITPVLSIITSIALDHTDLLGDTYEKIAREKAGIIKPGVPVVVAGQEHAEAMDAIEAVARENDSLTIVANVPDVQEKYSTDISRRYPHWHVMHAEYGSVKYSLAGLHQFKNVVTALAAASMLAKITGRTDKKFAVAVRYACQHVTEITGLRGRWDIVCDSPLTIIDVGHNPDAWKYNNIGLASCHETSKKANMHVILGFSADKDIDAIISKLPDGERMQYYFVKADNPRAVAPSVLHSKAEAAGLKSKRYPDVFGAMNYLRSHAKVTDIVFIGGSHFVAAEGYEYLGIDTGVYQQHLSSKPED